MPLDAPDFFAILECLARHRARFVIVGGVSAVLWGAPVMTFDLDVVHSRAPEDIDLLLAALRELGAHYRMHPQRIEPNASHLESPDHQLLMTAAGPLDLLGTIDEGRGYEDLIAWASPVEVEGHVYHALRLEHLIEIKERAGRDKDRAVLGVLRHTLEEQDG